MAEPKPLDIEQLMKLSAARRKIIEAKGWGKIEIQTLSVAERDDLDAYSQRGERDADGKSLFDYKKFVARLLEYGMVSPKITEAHLNDFRDDENGFIPFCVEEIQYFSGIIRRPAVTTETPLPPTSGSATDSAATSEA